MKTKTRPAHDIGQHDRPDLPCAAHRLRARPPSVPLCLDQRRARSSGNSTSRWSPAAGRTKTTAWLSDFVSSIRPTWPIQLQNTRGTRSTARSTAAGMRCGRSIPGPAPSLSANLIFPDRDRQIGKAIDTEASAVARAATISDRLKRRYPGAGSSKKVPVPHAGRHPAAGEFIRWVPLEADPGDARPAARPRRCRAVLAGTGTCQRRL